MRLTLLVVRAGSAAESCSLHGWARRNGRMGGEAEAVGRRDLAFGDYSGGECVRDSAQPTRDSDTNDKNSVPVATIDIEESKTKSKKPLSYTIECTIYR
jgi:hypothetical protein